ncbi:MAG: hypothetical protein A2925_03300 [Candidatus Yanofskybacteria bacterium RIFCSPLOWO2_01_FULL_44_22]|uniref:AAA+ ATPase domain-containing protein n=2 Tax=Candidatus Yanofskyibacteriota TaxID=1752733 RepID=A0A1F8GQ27_9BACT|nr:MAG: AAA ATPase central domain protein [Candidatus Yanofskybacteria bacterium GW2011_GWA2_44_9]OGN05520.1 MAG: hypothetical protein A2659_02935 [Candidatus Yanofskybacteria bacterium RIFCSPHIGHO2_01_FULL_44_24]OGN26539.1 MAG: hypothetical protein A2925_03300 [Candidatus Yanofskybacteria bacterium RIFCSPLOWO2_01_FULL_44_22]
MEGWLKEIDNKFKSGASHTFLLHLNVSDAFLVSRGSNTRLESINDLILNNSPLSEAEFVAFYNIGEGIRFASEKSEEKFLKFLAIVKSKKLPPALGGGNEAVEEFHAKRHSLGYALKLFSHMLRIGWKDVTKIIDKKAEMSELIREDREPEEFKKFLADKSHKPFFGAVFEYLETIVPPNSAHSSSSDDRSALVYLLTISKDQSIRLSRNILFLLTEGLTSVANQLESETHGIVPVKIDFPDQTKRALLYGWLLKGRETSRNLDVRAFAQHSAGMSINAITSLVKESSYKSEPITHRVLFERKKKFIEEQSGGLVEVIRPICGIKAIGGLDEHKRYIARVVEHMRAGNLSSIPTGVLLLGAPGTGKTVFAQSVAYEAEVPFVTLKNIREKWVGQSERNLDFALELILVLAPVVVFMDEIDQELQTRSEAPVGDSGVNNRLQGRLFMFMSDTNLRGKVMWIAASNRPDLIDPALLRDGRFDDKIPFFPPSAKERVDIVGALLYKYAVLSDATNSPLKTSEVELKLVREFARMSHCHLISQEIRKCDPDEFHSLALDMDKDGEDEIYFTGGQIENIIRRAIANSAGMNEALSGKHLLEALNDYIPPRDMLIHNQMTLLALSFCNSLRFIPKEGRWYKAARSLGIIGAESNTAKPKLS